jgi:hypothetical protein
VTLRPRDERERLDADLAERVAAFAAAGATSVTVVLDGAETRAQLTEVAKARAEDWR